MPAGQHQAERIGEDNCIEVDVGERPRGWGFA
jgi:hypothetical protein